MGWVHRFAQRADHGADVVESLGGGVGDVEDVEVGPVDGVADGEDGATLEVRILRMLMVPQRGAPLVSASRFTAAYRRA